jgi:hypothetical protein
MRFIELWLMPIVIEGPGKEISEDFGLLASTQRRGFTVSHIAG